MIDTLVSDLPEVYQPIYGHPELSDKISRTCVDRLAHIARIYDALQSTFDRPLKVLDLGCAQGFFCFNLAEKGAVIHGVDFLDKNIAVCNALARENPHLQLSFEMGRAEDTIARLEFGQFDLVLGLSIFHHIVHERDVDTVKALLEKAVQKTGALIVELALREEPLYWNLSQPQNPRMLLDSIAFVHEVARHSTHLAEIPRPLFVASNRYWVLGDKAAAFDDWFVEPHALAGNTHRRSRRYFFSPKQILKYYHFYHPRGAHNRLEFEKEIAFLKNPPNDFIAPKLLAVGDQEEVGWVVMQRLPGRLLLDLLREGAALDRHTIILQVLSQLSTLESAGLYHDDVRTWNVLVTEGGTVQLIDFGAISSKPSDCVWPTNLFLAFFIFVRELVSGVVEHPEPLRTIAISPYRLPAPYSRWAKRLWILPLADWSFKLMHQTLLDTGLEEVDDPLQQSEQAWMRALEEAVQAQKEFTYNVFQQAEAKAKQAEAKAEQAEAKAEQAEAKAEQAEAKAEQAEAKAEQAEAASNQHLAQLHTVYASTSWRITAPLRAMWWTLMWPHRYTAKLQMPLGAVRSGIQRGVASMVNSGIRCAQKSPRFRRLVFCFLHRMPAVLVKLRQIRIESQLSHGTYYFDSAAGLALTPELPSTGSLGHTAADLLQAPVVNGMNSQQRSPLEAYIHVYIGR